MENHGSYRISTFLSFAPKDLINIAVYVAFLSCECEKVKTRNYNIKIFKAYRKRSNKNITIIIIFY